MEGISRITEAIFREARAEADSIMENSKRSVGEIERLYEKEARISEEAILNAAEREADAIRRRSLSQSSIEDRNIKLSARHEMMERAFSTAERKLAALDKNDKKALYESMIIRYSSGNDVRVQLNKIDTEELGSKLKVKGMDILIEPGYGRFSGGIIIKEDKTEIDCTFKAMTENARKEMEPEIAETLFSQHEGGMYL